MLDGCKFGWSARRFWVLGLARKQAEGSYSRAVFSYVKKALFHLCLNGYTIVERNRAASVAASFFNLDHGAYHAFL